MSVETRSHRVVVFGRRARGGVLLGLTRAQLVCVGIALTVAVPAIFVGQFGLLFMTAFLWAPPLGLAFVPVAGRKLVNWLPVVRDFSSRRRRGQTSYRKSVSKPRPAGTLALPGRAASLRQVVHEPTGAAMVHDPHERTLTAILRVVPGAWTLAEPEEQDRRAEAWGSTLASFCTRNAGVTRLQVLERTLPESGVAAEAYWTRHGRDDGSWEAESYKDLLSRAAPASERHDALIAVVLDMSKADKKIRHAGGGVKGAADVLSQEMALLTSRLGGMDVRAADYLNPESLAEVLRGAYDPAALPLMARFPDVGRDLEHAGPVAIEEEWGHLRADSAYHCVLWVSEWPRVAVAVNFLWPLLLTTGVRRTVSTTFRPVPTAKALRAVRAEIVEHESEARQRAKHDVLETETDRREWDDTRRREMELASGAGDMDYVGTVVVSAWDLDSLHAAVETITTAAEKAHCEVRVLYGEQAAAFAAAALPLGRALR